MQGRMEGVAARSFAKLVDSCRFLSAEGGWRPKEEICVEVARSIKQLFHVLARTDNEVSISENELLKTLIDIDATYDGILKRVIENEPCRLDMDLDIPTVLYAALDFDRCEGTQLALEVVDAFETLGYAIIGSDGVLSDTEMLKLLGHVQAMHALLPNSDVPIDDSAELVSA